jgi:hypothetical protein
MVTAEQVLSRLPPYQDEWRLIKERQYVPDIITEICAAHRLYRHYYDRFSDLFYSRDPERVTEWLYGFCKNNIQYCEESVEFQTSAIPQGILTRGKGDCKHFALFNAGVIGSLNRLYGCCFDADFYFAGYRRAVEPYHVYVSVWDSDFNGEIWLDPTPGSGGTPSVLIEKPV